MKRVPQIVALVAVTLFIPITVSMPASAAFKCEIGYTGPDSENKCTSKEVFECEVTNENKVTIINSGDQEVASGEATVEGNGTAGNAISGSAENYNETTFNVTIVNDDTCEVRAVVPAKEETPPAPGKGEAPAPVKPAQEATPKALPVTSGSAAPVILATSGIISAAAIALAHRRLHL